MSDQDETPHPLPRRRKPRASGSKQEPADPSHNDSREGPQVIYLELANESRLPPDAWFEDAEGERAMQEEEERRRTRLSARR